MHDRGHKGLSVTVRPVVVGEREGEPETHEYGWSVFCDVEVAWRQGQASTTQTAADKTEKGPQPRRVVGCGSAAEGGSGADVEYRPDDVT